VVWPPALASAGGNEAVAKAVIGLLDRRNKAGTRAVEVAFTRLEQVG